MALYLLTAFFCRADFSLIFDKKHEGYALLADQLLYLRVSAPLRLCVIIFGE
jgi:hypothetical protein